MIKKILLVEDDKDLLDILKKKFEQEGLNILTAETGEKALQIINSDEKPALIVLDILLPDIDGITILSELVSNKDTRDIPVIILSNLDQKDSFEQVRAIGDYEYLVKSKTDFNDLVKKIKERLGL